MIQYLITVTSIWVVSLFYFLFLRKETFFHWNRIYLAGTCLLGLLLPLYSFNLSAPAENNDSVRYINQVVSVKEEIVQPAVTCDMTIGTESILWMIYISGCMVSLLLLYRELAMIYRMYKNGKSYPLLQWTIIETGQAHTPFSWRSLLFISQMDNYTGEEFDIISVHENVHLKRFHFADSLFISLLQVVFWFHPLVYIYKYLIKLTHEFEADSYKTNNTEAYGQFLIEQAIGSFQPALLHTFSSSPLKNRIMMLTQKKSTQLKAVKYMAVIPLLLFSFVMVTNAQKKLPVMKDLGNGKFEYMGNIFERDDIKKNYTDKTVQIKTDGGEANSVVIHKADGPPNILNGKKVQDPDNHACSMPVLKNKEENLSAYLFNLFKTEFEKLPDNDYGIHSVNFIIDEKGKMVYIERLEVGNSSISDYNKLSSRKKISDETKAILDKLSEQMKIALLYNTSFSPAMLNGSVVPAYYWEGFKGRKKIIVRNGHATITENND